jgi:hypothetical protein
MPRPRAERPPEPDPSRNRAPAGTGPRPGPDPGRDRTPAGTGRPGQPLTAPAVSPETTLRRKMNTSAAIGTTATTLAANRSPYEVMN